MPPRQTFIDNPALPHFWLEGFQQSISAARLRPSAKKILPACKSLCRAASRWDRPIVDEYTTTTDPPPLGLHTIAVAINMKPNHARAKGFHQLLSIAGVVAQIGDDAAMRPESRASRGIQRVAGAARPTACVAAMKNGGSGDGTTSNRSAKSFLNDILAHACSDAAAKAGLDAS